MVQKGNLAVLEGMQAKRSKISETGEAMPTKIGFHAFYVNLYLHEFLSRFYFLTPPPWTLHVIKNMYWDKFYFSLLLLPLTITCRHCY